MLWAAIVQPATVLLWVYGVTSWCMCFYVFFSCGEGIRWFATLHNRFLIFGAVCSAAAAPFYTIPRASLLLVFLGWSCYATLVSAFYWRYRALRWHLMPVNTPLLLLFARAMVAACIAD